MINILLPSTANGQTQLSYPDILTHLILTLFPSTPYTATQLTSVMRQLNLLLVGVIIAGSVRRVLKGVARALKLSGGGGVGGRKERERIGEVVVLVLGEVMVRVLPFPYSHTSALRRECILTPSHISPRLQGIYLLSTLIQLRTSFPPPTPADPNSTNLESSQEVITNLFSTLPAYEIFGPVFDWSFLLSVAVAAGGEWVRGNWGGKDEVDE